MSSFLTFVFGFFFGAAVVDFLWAYKMGIPQLFWSRIKCWRANRNRK